MESLSLRLQQGDETAFRELYDLYHHKLYRFCYGFLKDHHQSQEVVQETFVTFWTQCFSQKLKHDTSIKAFLFTIAYRHLIDGWRKQIALEKCKKKASLGMLRSGNGPEEYTLSRDYDHIYKQAFAQLNEQQQKVFELSREEGLSYHEIAERLDISSHTVKYHLTNALAVFRKYLIKHGILFVILFLF